MFIGEKMQVQVEGVSVRSLSWNHDNQSSPSDTPELVDGGGQVLDVFERVRADHRIKGAGAKREHLRPCLFKSDSRKACPHLVRDSDIAGGDAEAGTA